jgi:hypothetical protein
MALTSAVATKTGTKAADSVLGRIARSQECTAERKEVPTNMAQVITNDLRSNNFKKNFYVGAKVDRLGK